jgi:hypothetical protein
VLGLADEVHRDQRSVGGFVRDDQDFGWPGKEIDADLADAKKLTARVASVIATQVSVEF